MSEAKEFVEFGKIPRLSRDVVITEKIDGTNASIFIGEDGEFLCGSRTRWITPTDDNYGFAKWTHEHKTSLLTLGRGHHFGEWWGQGVQRNYSQPRKRWSLFNTSRWATAPSPLGEKQAYAPECCDVVPVLYAGPLEEFGVLKGVKQAIKRLTDEGSAASPGFMNPEGIVIYHIAANLYFKKTLHKDDDWKGKSQQEARAA